ncbi:alpha/beta hydrolase family protein [Mucilaginibacter terrae]|uniref:Pimeloyl-ACP methyl ester carboxylesterase n=1 Tax=Mucilaginibacter terrae TaxID=1955052 RepID=A0ABU3GUX7_9SPHI|nr:alpha/beta fold hydrolase [Mucilaginibacter terrae]MDT3403591.1 pimeloyl-ACP methyl ester carboxylesterase [Mucilaginibacter terrae]
MFLKRKFFFIQLIIIVFLFANVPVAFAQPAQQRVNVNTVPYQADSVTFTGKHTLLTYGATITIPANGNKMFPAVILVSGTGAQDRDGTMAGHKLFADIANYLSSRGIIVLRIDDRGVGKSTGDYSKATTADFSDDVLEAFNYLKTRPEVISNKIGIMGHSEGGASCSLAASRAPGIAFLVSIAGLALKGYDALIIQNRDLVNAAPISDIDKQRYNSINELMFKTALQYADSASMEQKLIDVYTQWKKTDDEAVKARHIEFDHFRFPIYSFAKQASSAWYRYFIKYDPAPVLEKVNIPILALNGDKDLMVSYKENLANWKVLSSKGRNTKVTTKIIAGLNHLFLPCEKCTTQEYPTIKDSFSPQALQIIADWLKRLKVLE